jgi:hypothetical protein
MEGASLKVAVLPCCKIGRVIYFLVVQLYLVPSVGVRLMHTGPVTLLRLQVCAG